MLTTNTVFTTIAVSDIDKGKQFYGETLGLDQIDENPGGVTYKSGDGKLFVYQSTTAGKGEATCAAWNVSDVEQEAKDLKAKGISFEQYDHLPGGTRDGDIHSMGPMKMAWFKDPDGNILSIGSE